MVRTDMDGKVCLVTGTTSGIGKATCKGLARMGATLVMVARDEGRGKAAKADIVQETGNQDIEVMLADLSSQKAIRELASRFKDSYDRLDVLLNNATIIPRKRTIGPDGIELQFAVNHLAYFLLTHLLLDVLKASAPSRILNVSSMAHRTPIDLDDLQAEHGYRAFRQYSRTKGCNILFTYELARRLKDTGVTVNCLHPGLVSTRLGREMGVLARGFFRYIAMSPEKGARTSVYLASSPEVEDVTGRYFAKGRPVRSKAHTYDKDIAARLWKVSEEMTGLTRFWEKD